MTATLNQAQDQPKTLNLITRLEIMVNIYDNPIRCEVEEAIATLKKQQETIALLLKLNELTEAPRVVATRKRIPIGYTYSTLEVNAESKLGNIESLIAII